jgi:hypothetical protein
VIDNKYLLLKNKLNQMQRMQKELIEEQDQHLDEIN